MFETRNWRLLQISLLDKWEKTIHGLEKSLWGVWEMNMFCNTQSLRTFSGMPVTCGLTVVIYAHQRIISFLPRHVLSSLTNPMKISEAVCALSFIYYYHATSSQPTQFGYVSMIIYIQHHSCFLNVRVPYMLSFYNVLLFYVIRQWVIIRVDIWLYHYQLCCFWLLKFPEYIGTSLNSRYI